MDVCFSVNIPSWLSHVPVLSLEQVQLICCLDFVVSSDSSSERRYRLFVDMPVSILPVISFGIDDGDVYGYSTLNINCCVDLGTIFTRLKSRTEKEIM